MGCGCGKAKRTTATAAPTQLQAAAFERGVARSKVMFVVTAAGEESVFYTLREARVFAEQQGVRVESRRMTV
jgi:hypothetical protein